MALVLFFGIISTILIGAAFIVGYIIAPTVEDFIRWAQHLSKSKDDDTI